MTEKILNVAVFFGGFSTEYSVSLESAYTVIRNLNNQKYRALPIGITRDGKWFYFDGEIEKIPADTWLNDTDCTPALLSPNRGEKALYLLTDQGVKTLSVDVAFPVMHGKFGEDGTIQGLIELSGIPLVGCGVLSSALCMDKDRAHRLAEYAGVRVPKSFAFEKNYNHSDLIEFSNAVGYPLFVKPVKSGSSYGVTKVFDEKELLAAVEFAFGFDDTVIVEQAIVGIEVSCAVMGNDDLVVGEVAEIETGGTFFDFTEKYTPNHTTIHIPARVSPRLSEQIKETSKVLYKALACRGFARADFFVTPEGRIVFNELNTIPGFTEHSLFPAMMKAVGLTFSDVVGRLVEYAVLSSTDN